MHSKDCSKYSDIMSLLIDCEFYSEKVLNSDKIKYNAHLSKCEKCAHEFDQLKTAVHDLRSLEQVDLPDNFHEEVMAKIHSERKQKYSANTVLRKNRDFKINLYDFGRYSALAASFIIVFFLLTGGLYAIIEISGFGSAQPSQKIVIQDSVEEDYDQSFKLALDANTSVDANANFRIAGDNVDSGYNGYGEDNAESANVENAPSDISIMAEDGTAEQSAAGIQSEIFSIESAAMPKEAQSAKKSADNQEMNIKTYRLDVSVEDLNTALATLNLYDQYITSMDSNFSSFMPSSSVVLRTPESEYDSILITLKSLGDVKSEVEGERTAAYETLDAEAKLKTRRIEYENIIKLLNETNDVTSMLTLENRLNEIVSYMETLQSQINTLSKQSAYPEINLTVTEKEKDDSSDEEIPTFGERVRLSFISSVNATIDSVENSAVILTYLIIPGILAGAAALIIFLLLKLIKRR